MSRSLTIECYIYIYIYIPNMMAGQAELHTFML